MRMIFKVQFASAFGLGNYKQQIQGFCSCQRFHMWILKIPENCHASQIGN